MIAANTCRDSFYWIFFYKCFFGDGQLILPVPLLPKMFFSANSSGGKDWMERKKGLCFLNAKFLIRNLWLV